MAYKIELRGVSRKSGQNRFCGPAVISALTGRSTQDASKLIRKYTGKHAVTGTHERDLEKALNACGFRLVQIPVPNEKIPDAKWSNGYRLEKPTLARWLDGRSEAMRESVLLVSAGNHWQLVEGDNFVCGQTRKIVPVTHKKVHRRARVRAAWTVIAFAPAPYWPNWWED